MKNRLIAIALLTIAFGCSEALPPSVVRGELGDAVARAEAAAAIAREEANRAREEAARTTVLLEQARALKTQAEQAEARCKTLDARIPKVIKPRVIYVQPKPTPVLEETPAVSATPVDPPHSVSDAPAAAHHE